MKDSIVRELRLTLGITQVQFAQLVGVSTDTISSIEQGRNGLRSTMVKKIFYATGAWCKKVTLRHTSIDPDDPNYDRERSTIPPSKAVYRDWTDGKPRNSKGNFYTKQDYRRHREKFEAEQSLEGLIEAAKLAVEELFRCAAPNPTNQRNKLPALQWSFLEWCTEVEVSQNLPCRVGLNHSVRQPSSKSSRPSRASGKGR